MVRHCSIQAHGDGRCAVCFAHADVFHRQHDFVVVVGNEDQGDAANIHVRRACQVGQRDRHGLGGAAIVNGIVNDVHGEGLGLADGGAGEGQGFAADGGVVLAGGGATVCGYDDHAKAAGDRFIHRHGHSGHAVSFVHADIRDAQSREPDYHGELHAGIVGVFGGQRLPGYILGAGADHDFIGAGVTGSGVVTAPERLIRRRRAVAAIKECAGSVLRCAGGGMTAKLDPRGRADLVEDLRAGVSVPVGRIRQFGINNQPGELNHRVDRAACHRVGVADCCGEVSIRIMTDRSHARRRGRRHHGNAGEIHVVLG